MTKLLLLYTVYVSFLASASHPASTHASRISAPVYTDIHRFTRQCSLFRSLLWLLGPWAPNQYFRPLRRRSSCFPLRLIGDHLIRIERFYYVPGPIHTHTLRPFQLSAHLRRCLEII